MREIQIPILLENVPNAIRETKEHERICWEVSLGASGCKVTFSEHDSEITKNGKVIGYSQNSKAIIILNKHTRENREFTHVIFDETIHPLRTSPLVDDDLDEEEAIREIKKKNLENIVEDETLEIDEIVNIRLKAQDIPSPTQVEKPICHILVKDGPYQTNPPSTEDIISSIRIDREGQVCRIRHEEEIDVLEYQILTHKIVPTLKSLEEIIQENVFYLGGNRDHVLVCLCFMLYYVVYSEKFNLAYYMVKRMEWVTKQARLILHYGMLLTRLFKFIMNEYPELYNESYVLYDRVMNPLAAQLERKPRRGRGTRRGRPSTSNSLPLINHLHLISTMMMMEMMKGPRVQALPLPFVMSIP
ncbi:hypothetical protein Tco_0212808 [Tanacetum coccineum]